MILHGDARHIPLADRSVQCVVTSPPYWLLRDYKVPGQMGQEPTPAEFVAGLVAVFREVWRVLRDDGTLWLNIGDSYSGAQKYRTAENSTAKSTLAFRPTGQIDNLEQPSKRGSGLADKQLVGIPWRVAFALQDDGWFLRSDIIWHKSNAMPSSVSDRPSCAHEYIFLFTKRAKYYYNHEAVKEPAVSTSPHHFVDKAESKQRGHSRRHAGFNGRYSEKIAKEGVPTSRNLRDVWTMATGNFSEAHYAVFPDELPRKCILAGCPEGGIVLDPFVGSGTTVKVAQDLGRKGIGLELGAQYIPMARRRTSQLVLC